MFIKTRVGRYYIFLKLFSDLTMPRMIKEEVSKGGGDISVTAVGLEQVTDSVPPDQE